MTTTELLFKIEGREVLRRADPGFYLTFTAKMAVDCDGMPRNTYHDPFWQKETSYRNKGRFLNADSIPYIVVPPQIIRAVRPIVLGCMAVAINLCNGLSSTAIVGDVGPVGKLGEGSCELAARVGLRRDPNHGGTQEAIIMYMLWPGARAVVDGMVYDLQAST